MLLLDILNILMCSTFHYLGHRQDAKIPLHSGLTPVELSCGTPPWVDNDILMTIL